MENGDFIGAKAFVLTGESSALVSNMNIRYNNVKTFYFSSTIKHKGGNYIHLFPNDNLINNVAILTSISKSLFLQSGGTAITDEETKTGQIFEKS